MDVIVIGAGAAGLMAAGQAALNGRSVLVIEKNKRPGTKLLLTGGGRCNLTNMEELSAFIKNIPGNGRFLFSCFSQFYNIDLIRFFDKLGVKTKVEADGRVFPVSNKSSDVVDALVRFCKLHGAEFKFSCTVDEILTHDSCVRGVRYTSGAESGTYNCSSVILAVGGASYPATGSTGDGYKIAKSLGHTIIPPRPALVPLEISESWVKELQGVSLKDVQVSILLDGKTIASGYGELIFTHFGISGPVILNLSRFIANQSDDGRHAVLKIKLNPHLTVEELDSMIKKEINENPNKHLKTLLHGLMPKSLVSVILIIAEVDGNKSLNKVTKSEILKLVEIIQGLPLTIKGTRPLKEAIVTAGGVSVKEINPKTMESKLVKGLYFAGEVVDVDGVTGGYNLQAAFSMGYTAGVNAAEIL